MNAAPHSEQSSRVAIPIRNLWVLLLYADHLETAVELMRAGVEENPDHIPELVASLLVDAARARMHRNLSPGYVHTHSSGARPRGRIDVAGTLRSGSDQRGIWKFRYDAHTVDTPRNRYLRETLERIAQLLAGRRGYRDSVSIAREAASLARTLAASGVAPSPPPAYRPDGETFGQHDRDDARLLRLARLFRAMRIPSQQQGELSVEHIVRDDEKLRLIFERAVYGILRHSLGDTCRVEHGGQLRWPLSDETPGAREILPGMKTDIVVEDRSSGARTIIDTKYTQITRRGRFTQDALHSGHLYQIYAYVRSQENARDASSMTASGVLLHPSVGCDVDESVWMQGHRFRFATVDLAADVRTIREQVVRAVVGV